MKIKFFEKKSLTLVIINIDFRGITYFWAKVRPEE